MDVASQNKVKAIVHEEIATAFLRVRLWIAVGVLANMLTIGLPAVVAGALYYSQVEQTSLLARANERRLDSRTVFIDRSEARIGSMEEFLREKHGYTPPLDPPKYD
jgi:hypothetical protein